MGQENEKGLGLEELDDLTRLGRLGKWFKIKHREWKETPPWIKRTIATLTITLVVSIGIIGYEINNPGSIQEVKAKIAQTDSVNQPEHTVEIIININSGMINEWIEMGELEIGKAYKLELIRTDGGSGRFQFVGALYENDPFSFVFADQDNNRLVVGMNGEARFVGGSVPSETDYGTNEFAIKSISPAQTN